MKAIRSFMNISVIIAVYNQQDSLNKCVDSVCNQLTLRDDIELLIIDDCSTDNTSSIIYELSQKYNNVHGLKTMENGGPGEARNLGLDKAVGNWILFLDSDDWLANDAISQLTQRIQLIESNLLENQKSDLISYNFDYDSNSDIKMPESGRKDLLSLAKDKTELIKDYLSLKMDGSVIYTLINKDIIDKNHLRFAPGYHEDIDFLFKVYALSSNISILNTTIYIKNNRESSIVNSITKKHIIGLFRSYFEIYNFYNDELSKNTELLNAFSLGVIAIIATRTRQISSMRCDSLTLYRCIYDEYLKLSASTTEIDNAIFKNSFDTKYIKIYKKFISLFNETNSNSAKDMNEFMNDIQFKSWSCYDLHNGLYLSSDEIRTCCKRFFVDGEIKGDVALLTPDKYSFSEYNIENIITEKKKLYNEINSGTSDKCTGCEFLEFKQWDKIKFQHISFEYHSVCNMKCTYCSDTYYGGKKNQYNVENLLNMLIRDDHLTSCNSIVWGGGEPTLGSGFEPMLQIMNTEFPLIQQRVISNATTISKSIKTGLDNGSVSLVTSIDAGTKDKFFEVRQHKQFHRVFHNLTKYAEKKPENITIKYIFLDINSDIEQVKSFVKNIVDYNLTKCNFQLSYDFNKEYVSEHDLALISIMHYLLSEQNVPLVFLDDLLRLRIKNSLLNYDELSNIITHYGYKTLGKKSHNKKKIVIWGAGRQTDYLLNDKHFLSLYEVKYLVDNTPEKIGSKLLNYDIYEPSKLIGNEEKVLISAVQYSSQIKKRYLELGLDINNIVTDLII